MNPDLPSPPDHSKTLIIIIASAVAAAVIGYAGYHQFNKWQAKEIQSAVAKKDLEMARTKAELEAKIQLLQNQPAAPAVSPTQTTPETPPPVADERLSAVFGGPQGEAELKAEPSCDTLKERLSSFFDYLRRNSNTAEGSKKALAQDWVTKIIIDLAAAPPLVIEETRDMASLKRNQSHFFRILKEDRFRMVKNILRVDRDVLEHALADCYQYYAAIGCCKPDDPACVSLKTLYEYAGFFMTTLSGKSYLLRRDSTIRCLVNYYCVLILDRANDTELNPYGIDIRPHIELALDEVSHQNNLIFKTRYIDTLNGLKVKYAKKMPELPEAAADDSET